MRNKLIKWCKASYIYFILAIIYIPLIVLTIWSFTAPSEKGNVQNSFNWVGGSNYLDLFNNNDFLNGLLNSVIIAGISTPLSVALGTITCYAIWNSNKYMHNSTLSIARVSLVNPEIITGISLTLLFASTWIALGMNLGFFTIILSHVSFCTPYAIITIYPHMMKFKKNLIDASNDLGYNAFRTFFKIVVPYLLPAIIGASALVAVMSFDDFIITNLVRGRITTISTEMYLMAKGIKTWAVTFGAFLVLLFITFIIIRGILLKLKDRKTKIKEINKIFKVDGSLWKK